MMIVFSLPQDRERCEVETAQVWVGGLQSRAQVCPATSEDGASSDIKLTQGTLDWNG